MQTEGQSGLGSVSAVAQSTADEQFAKDMSALSHEAAERLTFHRREAERWDRVGRAAVAAQQHLNYPTEVGEASPQMWAADAPSPAERF